MNDRFSTHFEHNEATRSQSILLELLTILGQYRDGLYLVGGWAPYYLLKLCQKPSDPFDHIGSIDIDLVIDETKISENQYSTIVKLITDRKYKPRKTRTGASIPFSFEKNIAGVDIAVDFLAREYGGASKKHRHQRIEDDLLARKARGADLLPEHHITFKLDGFLPDGSKHSYEVKMANLVSCLAMKGITIAERYKEKDAYDIQALLAHYKDGPASCLAEITPFLNQSLVKEGILSICEKFESENSVGPAWASIFMESNNPTAAKILQKTIYHSVFPFVEGMRNKLC